MKLKTFIITAILLGATSSVMAKSLELSASIQTEPKVKLIPQYGVSKLKGDYVDFNSTINTGIALDFMLSERFSIGAIFNYSLFELYDDQYLYSNNEIDLYQYNIGIQTKFFIIPTGVARPFISTGISYGHNELKFADLNQGYYNSVAPYYSDESLTYGTVAATVMVGSEIRFSRNVGLIIDGRYTQTFANGLNRDNGSNNKYYGESYELSNMEYLLEDIYTASLNVGLVIGF